MEDQSAQPPLQQPHPPPPVTTFPAFKELPLEVRSKIWVTASDDIPRPEMYRFRISHTATDAQTGQQVSCFTPAREVSSLTFQHRRLLRACAEANRELCRTPPYKGFHFYWTTSDGDVRRGTLRPFDYAFTSLCLLGMPTGAAHYPSRGLETLRHVQRLGFEYVQLDYFRGIGHLAQMNCLLPLWAHLRSLKTLGNFAPCSPLELEAIGYMSLQIKDHISPFSVRRCACMESIPSQTVAGPERAPIHPSSLRISTTCFCP